VATSGAFVVSLGATGQFGYKGFFVVADFNGSLADVERIADLMGSNLLSFRGALQLQAQAAGTVDLFVGRNGRTGDRAGDQGSVKLADVIPCAGPARHSTRSTRSATNTARSIRARGLREFRRLARGLGGRTSPPDSSVQYALNKEPKDIWNMIVGAQFALNRNWYFRSEVGFLGSRTSFLVGTEYKFDI
jgi:hypothetical protein